MEIVEEIWAQSTNQYLHALEAFQASYFFSEILALLKKFYDCQKIREFPM